MKEEPGRKEKNGGKEKYERKEEGKKQESFTGKKLISPGKKIGYAPLPPLTKLICIMLLKLLNDPSRDIFKDLKDFHQGHTQEGAVLKSLRKNKEKIT